MINVYGKTGKYSELFDSQLSLKVIINQHLNLERIRMTSIIAKEYDKFYGDLYYDKFSRDMLFNVLINLSIDKKEMLRLVDDLKEYIINTEGVEVLE